MTNNYKKAYQEIESKILSDTYLTKSVDLIALLGSVSDKEVSLGWSDLDVLVVLKTDKLGNIAIKNLKKLRMIALKISKTYSFPISILSHSIDDLEKYVSFEYLKHYSLGECTYPSRSYLKQKIEKILKSRNVDDLSRKAYCVYHIRHSRFNLLRKFVSLNACNTKNYKKDFAKLLIDKMIKVTDLALNYKNIWPKTKVGILSKAFQHLNVDTIPLRMAFDIREKWIEITDKEIDLFEDIGIKYIIDVSNLVLSDYQNSTPEERMSSI